MHSLEPPFCFGPLGGRGSAALPTAFPVPEEPPLLPITPTLLPEVSVPPTGLGATRGKGSTADCVDPRPKTPDPEPKRLVEPRLPLVPTEVMTPLEFVLLIFVPIDADSPLPMQPEAAACA